MRRIWRIGDVLREEGRKFGTLRRNIFDGCFSGVTVREHLARGPTH